eukprot:1574308-Amphidinium_carterae.1
MTLALKTEADQDSSQSAPTAPSPPSAFQCTTASLTARIVTQPTPTRLLRGIHVNPGSTEPALGVQSRVHAAPRSSEHHCYHSL